jgi:hypothetical protein
VSEVSTTPRLAVVASGGCSGSKAPVASKDPRWSNLLPQRWRGVAPVSPAIGPEAFVTGGALNPPLCERIHDTLRYSTRVKQ